MKILLIDPPFQRFLGYKCDWYPIGLGFLASVLKGEGHTVQVYNAEHHPDPQYLNSHSLTRHYDAYLQGLQDEDHLI